MQRALFLDLCFDTITMDVALDWVAARNSDAAFAYVVTPNVDHMVRLPSLSGKIRRAYSEADLCLCDSRILARLAKMCGTELTVVPGSDLTARLLETDLRSGSEILLIGGRPDDQALLSRRFPRLSIAQHIPPMGLLGNASARAEVVAVAAARNAAVILLAVGSPQQELLAAEMKDSGRVCGTALCIGASVDFLVGRERRAPKIVQRMSLEWAWRLLQNPGRLGRRYLIDDPKIFAQTWAWKRRAQRFDQRKPPV
jgi:N-acetylglucosaminyldiphosphoundecaprenol N-acetyl-beta-D-mannosaminyltransferase